MSSYHKLKRKFNETFPSIQITKGKHFNQFIILELGNDENDDSDELIIKRNPSIILPHLQYLELYFFDLIKTGKVALVKKFLNENRRFNVNCINYQGVSALHLAVQIQSEDMVKYLLSRKTIDVGDIALYAVRDNLPRILEIILNHIQKIAPGLEYAGYIRSSEFADHITPLVLAAQCGHYKIIELLMERGHRIIKPHKPYCSCKKCKLQLEHNDLLHMETRRLSLFQAISNPAYICHSTDDPILQSFLLSRELDECALNEPELQKAYTQLSENVNKFAVDLIGFCRTSKEMLLILKQPNYSFADEFNCMYPRLVTAMDFKQKQFVAHPNTQQVITVGWRETWYSWKQYSGLTQLLILISRIFVLPILAVLILVAPFHPIVKKYSTPLNKLINHTASYLLFLVLIFIQSSTSKKGQIRGPPNTGLEPFIILYVFGFVWSTTRMVILQGPARYFQTMWSWYEIVMSSLFVNTFLFWITAYFHAKSDADKNLERKYWHYLEPTLISESLFAFATIMAFFRLLILFQLNFHLGPLHISLGKMASDITKFILIFFVVITAWTAGLQNLYHYYDGMVQIDNTTGIKTVQISSFTDVTHTLKTLFWAILCLSPLESADVIIENIPSDNGKETIINNHTFTQGVGYVSFAGFEILCVIIILNMLLATMSNTFQRVVDNVDIEWIFGRTEVYVTYMLQTALPPPFNLIPTYGGLKLLYKWISLLINPKKSRTEKAKFNFVHCCYIHKETDPELAKYYRILMNQLVQRYFREKETKICNSTNDTGCLKQDILEIKNLIKSYNVDRISLKERQNDEKKDYEKKCFE